MYLVHAIHHLFFFVFEITHSKHISSGAMSKDVHMYATIIFVHRYISLLFQGLVYQKYKKRFRLTRYFSLFVFSLDRFDPLVVVLLLHLHLVSLPSSQIYLSFFDRSSNPQFLVAINHEFTNRLARSSTDSDCLSKRLIVEQKQKDSFVEKDSLLRLKA